MKEKIYAALGLLTMLVVGALVLEGNKPWYFTPSSGDPYGPGDVDPTDSPVRMPSFSEVLSSFDGPFGIFFAGPIAMFQYALVALFFGLVILTPVIILVGWLVDWIKRRE